MGRIGGNATPSGREIFPLPQSDIQSLIFFLGGVAGFIRSGERQGGGVFACLDGERAAGAAGSPSGVIIVCQCEGIVARLGSAANRNQDGNAVCGSVIGEFHGDGEAGGVALIDLGIKSACETRGIFIRGDGDGVLIGTQLCNDLPAARHRRAGAVQSKFGNDEDDGLIGFGTCAGVILIDDNSDRLAGFSRIEGDHLR